MPPRATPAPMIAAWANTTPHREHALLSYWSSKAFPVNVSPSRFSTMSSSLPGNATSSKVYSTSAPGGILRARATGRARARARPTTGSRKERENRSVQQLGYFMRDYSIPASTHHQQHHHQQHYVITHDQGQLGEARTPKKQQFTRRRRSTFRLFPVYKIPTCYSAFQNTTIIRGKTSNSREFQMCMHS